MCLKSRSACVLRMTILPSRLTTTIASGDRNDYFREPHTRPMGEGRELSGRRKDGSEFNVRILLLEETSKLFLNFLPCSGVSDDADDQSPPLGLQPIGCVRHSEPRSAGD